MAAKQIVFSEDARRKLKNGMNTVANAVGTTLGPKGRNVAIDRKFGSPTVTHDGVSVAKEIELEGVYLLNEGTDSWRPVPFERLDEHRYRILPTVGYDQSDEEWEFPPFTVVEVE